MPEERSFDHGGRVADEVAHGGSGAEAVAEDTGLDIERPALGGAIEGGGELFEGEGLGEIVAGADAHGFDRRGDAGEGCHDDDDGLGMAGANVFEQREASAAGELEIEQEDIDGVVGQGETRGGDGFGGLGGEAEALGDLGAGVADGGVVVDAARDGGGVMEWSEYKLVGWSGCSGDSGVGCVRFVGEQGALPSNRSLREVEW